MVPNAGPILVADDNPDDVALLRLAFQKAGFSNRVEVVNDGDEAIQYLKGEGAYADRVKFPWPLLLFLDLKMPRVSGLEVLAWLRGQSQLASLQVIVLSHSSHDLDVREAYRLGAKSFLVKPSGLHEFVEQMKAVGEFWLARSKSLSPGARSVQAPPGTIPPPGTAEQS